MFNNIALLKPFIARGFRIAKKAIIVLIAYFVIINLFFYFINKDKIQLHTYDPVQRNREKIYATINDPELNSSEMGKIDIALYRYTNCWLIGEACTDNPADGNANVNHSVTGFLSSLLVLPFTQPPASGIHWAISGLQNAGFIPKTYAAEGVGFAALGGFRPIWTLFRNFVMMIMVLVVVTIGFMIMFRSKINAQTVISIENSLPKIVIALLLITFSFAIAGFMIDLMYICMGLVVTLLKTNNQFTTLEPQDFLRGNVNLWQYLSPFGNNFGTIIDVANSLYGILPSAIQTAINTVIYSVLGNLVIGMAGGLASRKLPALKSAASYLNPLSLGQKILNYAVTKASSLSKLSFIAKVGAGTGTVVVSLALGVILIALTYLVDSLILPHAGRLIVVVLLLLSLLFIYFRILFMLLSTYLSTILLVIFSPLILALEAVPGKNSFSSWIKNLALNLLTFPAFVLLLMVAQIIISMDTSQAGMAWKPPFLFNFDAGAFQTIVGGVLLFAIPDLIKGLKEATGVKPMPLNIGVGTMFTGITSTLGGGMGVLGQFSTINLGLSALGVKDGLGGILDKNVFKRVKGYAAGLGGPKKPTQSTND